MSKTPFDFHEKTHITPDELFSKHAIQFMCDTIASSNGNEVFFTGIPNEIHVIDSIKVFARGNKESVPAVVDAAEFGHMVIHNHPSGILTPSSADMDIAVLLNQSGIGSCIINNDVTDCYVITLPAQKEKEHLLDIQEIAKLIEPNGLFSRQFNGYEYRSQQVTMLKMVADTLNNDSISMIEAGTGTGKSMAYLIPLIYWARRNKQRCVISTKTINLQEQLLHKDIPALKHILPENFTACLIKGKSNYLCKRKLDMILKSPESHLDTDKIDELRRIADWSEHTKDGSLSDLNFVPAQDIWDAISADSDSCTRAQCSKFGNCFITQARQKASASDILITNHHLLFADISIRKSTGFIGDIGILPPYQRVVIDEAHHIEDVATSYFGAQITQVGILRMLGRLYQIRGKKTKGLWTVLYDKINTVFSSQINASLLTKIHTEYMEGKIQLEKLIKNFFYFLADFLSDYIGDNKKENKWRIPADKSSITAWKQLVAEPFLDLQDEIKRYSHSMKRFLADLDKLAQAHNVDLANELTELSAVNVKFERAIDTLEIILFGIQDYSQDVRWIELGKHNQIRLYMAPISVADNIYDSVIGQFPSVILTSATLTTEGNFDFLSHRIGIDRLDAKRLRTAVIPSPFEYQTQVLIGIPSDLPEPSNTRFTTSLADMISETLKITEGKTFVLFTSFALLDICFELVKKLVRSMHLSFLKQGTQQRHSMLDKFRQNERSVLFGTDSFWEGVDVKGRSLECVILTRLPFRVPTDPIIEARVEHIKQNGGNPFMDYLVPMAVVKFRQGFGRLIRTKQDRGCVLIMDKRVLSKNYGKRFLESLPQCQVIIGQTPEILGKLKQFFY